MARGAALTNLGRAREARRIATRKICMLVAGWRLGMSRRELAAATNCQRSCCGDLQTEYLVALLLPEGPQGLRCRVPWLRCCSADMGCKNLCSAPLRLQIDPENANAPGLDAVLDSWLTINRLEAIASWFAAIQTLSPHVLRLSSTERLHANAGARTGPSGSAGSKLPKPSRMPCFVDAIRHFKASRLRPFMQKACSIEYLHGGHDHMVELELL